MTRIAILSRQVTNYHHARFQAASRVMEKVDILSLANEGKFNQILSEKVASEYRLHSLFTDLDSYHKAAAQGTVLVTVTGLLDLINPDVVAISGWASAESFAALIWARNNERGVVLFSDSQVHDAKRHFLRDWIKGRIVKLCDAGLVAGGTHRAYLEQLGMPPERIGLGYDVVDNEHFSVGAAKAIASEKDSRVRLGLPAQYIFASARFIPKKNLHVLLSAYAKAREGMETAPDLVVAGDGELRPALEAELIKLGLSACVHFPGFFAYSDMPALYGLAKGFVHVPLSEQWGLVVNEAASSGQPMILSKGCGATGELLREGINGWSVHATDVCGLAGRLRKMISLSTMEREKMGGASREIVAEWGPERFARELSDLAQLAAASNKKPISSLDRQILRFMSRKVIETVA